MEQLLENIENEYSNYVIFISSVQLLSHVRLCHLMECSTPGLPVHHQLPKLAQTHVLCVSDVIQPSNPLSSPSPAAFNLSQHRGYFHSRGQRFM